MIFSIADVVSFLVPFSIGVAVSHLLTRDDHMWPFTRLRLTSRYVSAILGEPMKMTLVVRKDLKMGTGKIAAQCAHAAVAAVEEIHSRRGNLPDSAEASQDEWIVWHDTWALAGSKKIALQCDGEAPLMEALRAARREGIPCALVRDAGRTQVAPGSKTVLAVGPAPTSVVDRVTGAFKLL